MNKASKKRNSDAFSAVQEMLAHIRRDSETYSFSEEFDFRFGSANALFAAGGYIWQQLGLKPNEVLLMKHFSDISRYVDQSRFSQHPRLNTLKLASDYLVSNFHGLQTERFYMLCLDRRGFLKEKVFLGEGTADSALVNLHKLLSEAMRISPSAVILSHNHPGGTRLPSQEDISSTLDAMRALSVMDMPLLDHIIVAGGTGVSMRLDGFIPEHNWLSQQSGHRLLSSWAESEQS